MAIKQKISASLLQPDEQSVPPLAYAFGGPPARGVIRARPEHFRVDEDLGFEPSGDGTHAWLRIRKTGCNTEWVSRQLARFAGVKPLDVGYAGLKDRHAVTSQWFSVNLAGRPEPDWQALESPALEILTVSKHSRKLRRGTLKGNRFEIVVTELTADREALQACLQQVAARGVPNYFGEQRFGVDGGNVAKALALFDGRLRERNRHKRGLYLSAARSHLFNRVLSARVEQASWDKALDGDVMMLSGTHSIFTVESVDDAIRRRVAEHDIHPTGPLWGRGETASGGAVWQLEDAMASQHPALARGLEQAGMGQERRPLRLGVSALDWHFSGEARLTLRFTLAAGSYATSVLRELVDCNFYNSA